MDRYRVEEGTRVDLSAHDPEDRGAFPDGKKAGKEAAALLNERLETLQELLYAEGKHRVLVVLQAMDTGGKDSTIRHVFDGVNPQGVKVARFQKPVAEELARDYLWRVHREVPRDGQITIFNRSHYEDVLVVRVHELVAEPIWRKRYAHIRAFEERLVDEGTTILKFFLHISRDEQRKRLQERLDNPDKHWKFDHSDLESRRLWVAYQTAYEDALTETSTPSAPWYVVPADSKWYRNLVVSQILVDTLDGLGMCYPVAPPGLGDLVID
jgi:PPK2 family polyphosphate:nucleotide phosphotransferase